MTDNPRLTLMTAQTTAEVLEALARREWWQAHAEDEAKRDACPADMIPSETALAEWLWAEMQSPHLQETIRCAALNLSATYDGAYAAWQPLRLQAGVEGNISPPRLIAYVSEPDPSNGETVFTKDQAPALEPDQSLQKAGQILSILVVHERWCVIPEVERPPHPLAPIVRTWQEWKAKQPRGTEPFTPTTRASLPRLHRIAADSTLPGFPGSDAPAQGDQLALPGFEPTIMACPSWLLWLFDTAGGESMAQGRGAPWDLHLFVSSFLHLAHGQRDGHWRTLRFPHLVEHEADWPVPETPSIERWLFEDGWTRQNKKRDWHRLPEALNRMKRDLGYVPVDGGRIALVFPSVIPDSMNFPVVEFTVRVPASAASGARVDWNRLRQYRLGSAALYRAYLAAVAFMDRAAHHGHGITAEIAPPVLGPDGKPLRGKGGKIKRSLTETIPNRHAHFVKALDDRDLTRMIGLDPDDKRRRADARRAFERLTADGVIDLRKDRDGWRIFAPGRDQT